MSGEELAPIGANEYDSAVNSSDVVMDLLDELRAGQYGVSAWARFVTRSWKISQQTAQAHPRLARSWRRVAVGLTLAECAALLAEARLGGATGGVAARQAAPGTALCLTYTLFDAYTHLGMNQSASGEPLYDTLGLPTILTLTRGAVTGMLLGRLLGRAPLSRGVVALALAAASVSDVADGYLARKTKRTTRLGAYLDSETDFGFGVAMALTLLARGKAPFWFVSGMLARWLAPFAFALVAYFGQGRRVQIGSTALGKAAGLAQTLTFGVALAPERALQRLPGPMRLWRVITLALFIAAPLYQVVKAQSR